MSQNSKTAKMVFTFFLDCPIPKIMGRCKQRAIIFYGDRVNRFGVPIGRNANVYKLGYKNG